jgi:hypothetical protein
MTAELTTSRPYVQDSEVSCTACGLDFVPDRLVEHQASPGETHRQALALDLLSAEWDTGCPDYGLSNLGRVATESGLPLLAVRTLVADLFL